MTHVGFLRPRRSIHDDFNVITGEFEGFDYSNPLICHGKGSSGGTSTTVQSSQIPQQFLDAYSAALGKADAASSAPLQQYQGQTVAGLTPDQTQAFGTIANAQGMAQPYINQASNLISGSTANLWNGVQQFSPDAISQYSNPYTQQVLNAQIALEQNQDAQQQEALKGNIISSGAWGGDRAGVAQAALAGQQALANNSTNANILNTGYNQALQEFNQQQQAQLGANATNAQLAQNGAYALGNLGSEALSSTLSGAAAQLQSGTLQQAQNQAELNVPYEQFLQQQANPFQTAQYYANIAEGLGSTAGSSGTSTTTTTPSYNTGSSVFGNLFGGLGILGSLAKRGGRIRPRRYAAGGALGGYAAGGGLGAVSIPDLSVSYVPITQAAVGHAPQTPASGSVGNSSSGSQAANIAQIASAVKGLKKLGSFLGTDSGLSPSSASGIGGISPDGTADLSNSAIDSLTGENAAASASNAADFMGSNGFDLSSIGSLWKRGGAIPRRYKVGGDVLPDVLSGIGDVVGAFFGYPMAGDTAVSLLSKLDGGATGGDGVGKQALSSILAAGGRVAPGGFGGMFADGGLADDVSTDNGIQVSGSAPKPPSSDDLQRFVDVQNDIASENSQPVDTPLVSAMALLPPGEKGGLGSYAPQDSAPEQTPASGVPDQTAAFGTQGQAPSPSVQDQMPAPPAYQPPAKSPEKGTQDLPQPEREKVDPWLALATAGFSMAAGRSPYFGQNLAEGALAGLQNYAQQRQHVDSVNQAADKMMEEAKEHRDRLAIDQKNADTNAQYRQDQAAYQKGELALRSKQVEQGKWVPIKDALGNEYLINPTTNEVRDPAGVTSGGQSGRSVANIYSPPTDTEGKPVTGENYLQLIPPQIAALSKGYASGMMAPPTGMATRNPTVIAAWTAAQQADPNFATHAATRYTTIQQFVNPNSKTAMTVRAQNVAMEHIQTMREAVEALNNHDVRAYNTAVNAVARQAGYAEPTNAEIGQNILGDELAKAIIAGGGALADREAFKKGLGTGASLNQALGGLNEYEKYMAGQMQGLERGYQAGTGLNDFAQRVNLSPAAQEIMAKYSHPVNSNVSSDAAPPPAAAIEALRKDPSLAPMFEKKYGVPAAGFIGGQ